MRKLCLLTDIELNQARGFPAKGGPIVVHRDAEGVRAYRDSCPHLGIDMAWNPDSFMDSDQQHIQCSTHGALFEPKTGECVFGPCVGKFLEPYPVEVRGDEIWG